MFDIQAQKQMYIMIIVTYIYLVLKPTISKYQKYSSNTNY